MTSSSRTVESGETPVNMWDHAVESRESQTFLWNPDEAFLSIDPGPPTYIQAMYKRNTVKELLMMRRQKRPCSQQDNQEPSLKSIKCEVFPYEASPPLMGPAVPPSPNTAVHFPLAVPDCGYSPPPLTHLPLPPQMAPATGAPMSLFQWQIQQEANRLGGMSPELLNTQDADGDTFLHIAVAQGRRALAYVLARRMAGSGSLDMKEHNGQTALQIATATNQHLIVQDLLEHGAHLNTLDLWGRSPLHVCAEKGHFSSLQSIWKSISGHEQAVDVDMFNFDGLTSLHVAVLSHNAVVSEQRRLAGSPSRRGTELVQRRHMYVQCIQMLLTMGASCGAKDLKSGRTCLHMASEVANVELLNIFLNLPLSLNIVNVKTFGGNTALHIVSSLQNHKHQVEAVKLLMRKGADPGARNIENEVPSQLVAEGLAGDKVRQILKGKHIQP